MYVCKQTLRPHAGFTTIIGKNYINANVIKWHIANFTPDMDKYKVILAFSYAFRMWQRYLDPIKLESTGRHTEANIIVNFASNRDSRLPERFENGVLAYAYAPINNKTSIWFNEEEDWGEMNDLSKIDLKKVAVHEIGHALNLGHTMVEEDIMFPTYNPTAPIVISSDSIQGIEYLYGAKKRELNQGTETKDDDIVYKLIKFWFQSDRNLHVLNHGQLLMISNALGLPATIRTPKKHIITNIYAYLNIDA